MRSVAHLRGGKEKSSFKYYDAAENVKRKKHFEIEMQNSLNKTFTSVWKSNIKLGKNLGVKNVDLQTRSLASKCSVTPKNCF